MASTAQLGLPLLAAAQAQKHITVNEALARLDGLVQLRLVSDQIAVPPVASDGESFLIPVGAIDAWSGHVGEIAVRSNGGWCFVSPRTGWRAWNLARGAAQVFDGVDWREDAVAVSGGGAATVEAVIEIDHVIAPGSESAVVGAIPAGSVVTGVSGRLVAAVTGTASGWSLGVAGAPDRYGSDMGIGVNSYVVGLTGQPQAYYADTDLLITAEGGSFAGGEIRFAVHLTRLLPPRAV